MSEVQGLSQLRRILAATDFSPLGDAAIHRAALLAARAGSELLILHAMPAWSVLDGAFGASGDLPARMRGVAEARLAELIKRATQAGAQKARGKIVEGAALRVVLDEAANFHPDLLAIGAHGQGMLQQFFLGGTVSRLLADAASPVLVVRRAVQGDYGATLVAVDLGPRSSTVLRAAITVAAQSRLTTVHAYQAPFEAKLRYKGFSEDDIVRYSAPEALTAQGSVDALFANPEFVGLEMKMRIVHGHPNQVLFDAATALGVDLIAVGKHGGSRLGEKMMGSITRLLAYYAPCDVLVV